MICQLVIIYSLTISDKQLQIIIGKLHLCDNLAVKAQYYLCNTRSNWLKKPFLSHSLKPWLINSDSLTKRLQKRYTHFFVKPILIKFAKPFTDESFLLRSPMSKQALIREVLLMGNDNAVVFAHSVLPRPSLRGPWNGLSKIGNQSLGETLFANPKIKRTCLTYKKLARHHPLSMRLTKHIQLQPAALWARRSIFVLSDAKIMVTEVFLPRILNRNYK